MEKLYARVLRVQALLRGSNSPTSRSPEAVDWIMRVKSIGGKILAMAKLYTRVLRVQALLRGSNSSTSRCPEAVGWIMRVCVLQGVRTLVLVEGVAYIECARTPASPRYKEFNVHKEGALQVMSVIKCYK